MLKHVIDGGKALYIVPLIALANEKYNRFREFEQFGVLTGISTGELESKSEGLGKNDIIVCTSEKTDSMLRNGTQWLQTLSIVVVDEVHLLDEKTRGPTLEIVMTKLRKIPNLQIVALSATIGNTQVLADWLKAELTVSDWRPTKLQEGIVFERAMNFLSENPVIQRELLHDTKEPAADVALDTIKEGGQCLVFESSRRTCMAFAKRFSNPKNREHKQINILLSNEEKLKLAEIADEIEYASDTTESNYLAECIRNGVCISSCRP
jgi:helicase